MTAPDDPSAGALAANLMHFARLLRRAGLPVGPAEVIAAGQALTLVEIGDRDEVRATLRSVMVHRHDLRELFDRAFALFWRAPAEAAEGDAPALPERAPPGSRRLAEAFADALNTPPRPASPEERPDAALSAGGLERLQTLDFEAMSAAEIAAAKAEIRRLRLPLDARRTRRRRPDPAGPQLDLRATLREGLRGGELLRLRRTGAVVRSPPLVVLCDISGSMARYAGVLLHFLHAVSQGRDRVHVFLFGTRLTNVTRELRHRDPEAALEAVARAVPDWSGGTRIGAAIGLFNRLWARRVLGGGAVVLLVTDGLDRAGAEELSEAAARLHRSCRRLIWLNPLLRWSGFQPKSASIRALLPHVDEFRPVHDLASLRALTDALSRPAPPGAMRTWRNAT